MGKSGLKQIPMELFARPFLSSRKSGLGKILGGVASRGFYTTWNINRQVYICEANILRGVDDFLKLTSFANKINHAYRRILSYI